MWLGVVIIGVTFVTQSQFFFKKLYFLISIGLHVLRDFRLDGIQQHVLRNASFTVRTISSKLSSILCSRQALFNSS